MCLVTPQKTATVDNVMHYSSSGELTISHLYILIGKARVRNVDRRTISFSLRGFRRVDRVEETVKGILCNVGVKEEAEKFGDL